MDQEAVVRLNVEVGGDAPRAFRDMAGSARGLAEAERRAKDEARGLGSALRERAAGYSAAGSTARGRAGYSASERLRGDADRRMMSAIDAVASRLIRAQDQYAARLEENTRRMEELGRGLLRQNADNTAAERAQRKRGKEHAEEMEEAEAEGRRRGRRTGAGASGVGVGDFGKGLAALLAATEAAAAAVGKAGEIYGIAHNSLLTLAQKNEKIGEAMPFGIGAAARYYHQARDEFTGTNDRIRVANVRFAQGTLADQQWFELQAARVRRDAEIATPRLRGVYLSRLERDLQGEAVPTFNRGTFTGEQAYRDYRAVRPAELAERTAHAEADAANEERRQTAFRVGRLENQRGVLQERVDRARAREEAAVAGENLPAMLGGGRDRAGRHEAGLEAMRAEKALAENIRQLEQERLRLKEQSVGAANAVSAAEAATLDKLRAQLSVLEQQEQRLASRAQSVGGMNVVERQLGLQGARAIRDAEARGQGLDTLSPELRDYARRFAPEYVRKAEERFGQQTAEYRQAQREGFIEKGDLGQIREEVRNLHATVQVRAVINEKVLADRIVEAMSRYFEGLIRDVKARQANEQAQQRTGQRIQQNNQ
jgi:hypothetical protein